MIDHSSQPRNPQLLNLTRFFPGGRTPHAGMLKPKSSPRKQAVFRGASHDNQPLILKSAGQYAVSLEGCLLISEGNSHDWCSVLKSGAGDNAASHYAVVRGLPRHIGKHGSLVAQCIIVGRCIRCFFYLYVYIPRDFK